MACLPPFFLFFPLPCLCSFSFRLVCPLSLLCLFLCPWVSLFLVVGVLLGFLFPFRYIRKKERAQFLASSLILLWVVDLVGVRFPVLVKFVIVSLNLFGDTFIGNCIFVIVSPLLEKAFENTLNKIPRVKFVLYALLYVV